MRIKTYLLGLLAGAWLSACNEAPRVVTDGPLYEGTVRLTGALIEQADEPGAAILVMARPNGPGSPYLVRKYDLSTTPLSESSAGELYLRFELTPQHVMSGEAPPPTEVAVEAWFDGDGSVDTKDDIVLTRVMARRGARGLDLVLEP